MSVFTRAARTVAEQYQTAYRANLPVQVIKHAQQIKNGDRVINLTAIRRVTPTVIKNAAPVVIKQAARGLAFTIVAMEVVDLFENELEKRRRRARVSELIRQAQTSGMTDEILRELNVLTRADERRSPVQFAKDLPQRTFRRLHRAVLVEAGWWYMFITTPIWTPVFLADLLYGLVLVPIAAVISKAVFSHDLNVERVVNFPRPVVNWIMGKTFFAGYRVFTRGSQMRMHNKTKVRANTDYYSVFDQAKDKVYAEKEGFKTGPEAYEFGARLAELIHEQHLSAQDMQGVYAQMTFWVREHVSVSFANAVQQGFAAGVPVYDRDQIQVVVV